MDLVSVSGMNMLNSSALGLLSGGGGLPTLFDWNPELAEALPATSTFTRASVKQVLTTTDGTTFWYQEAKSGEVPLDGLRRVENALVNDFFKDYAPVSGASINGTGDEITFPGVTAIELVTSTTFVTVPIGTAVGWRVKASVSSGTATVKMEIFESASASQDIVLTTTPQIFWISAAATVAGNIGTRLTNQGAGGPYATTIIVEENCPCLVQDASAPPEDFVQATATTNADVDGVQYFNTTNANSVDGNGVVTEATGTTITGGGYLPEPAATNQLIDVDISNSGIWTHGNVTVSDQGINSLGLREYEIDVGTGTTFHRIFDASQSGGAGSSYVIAKEGTERFLIVRRGSASDDYACFDLQLGTITEEGAGIDDAIITDFTDGYYKCEVNTSNAGNEFYVYVSDVGTPGSADRAWTGANETVLVCHVQWENTVFSTSPIITSGSTVTRVADVLTFSSISSLPYSIFCDVTYPDVIFGESAMFHMGGVTRLVVYPDGGNFQRHLLGGDVSIFITGSGTEGTREKLAASLETNDCIYSITSETTQFDTTAATIGINDVDLGNSSSNVNQFRGVMHNIIVYSVAQTQAELEALVA